MFAHRDFRTMAACGHDQRDLPGCRFYLLDEPTAAIDPLEETRLYGDFAKICTGKTSVLITHRLGSVKMADRIIVMKEGKVVQNGTHENLIRVEGEYKKLYEAQRKWYV